MESILYIKYGELSLKGKNKKIFVNLLYQNILKALKDFQLKVEKNYDFTYIFLHDQSNEFAVIEILKLIPGIQYIIQGIKIERDFDLLAKVVYERIDSKKTFKILARRIDKTYERTSREIMLQLVDDLVEKFSFNGKVDVRNPEQEIHIEIKKAEIVIFSNKIRGVGGFPVGINGSGLVLLSGGIDSPVAACLLQKKGIIPHYITFITPPYTSDMLVDKIEKLVEKITLNGKISNGNLHIVNFTSIFNEIQHISDSGYTITIMRRMFFKIASEIAKILKYSVLATGESIGQVASQTIENMEVIEELVENKMIVRPLICMDKIEIIELAKFYDTFETSILPYSDLCALSIPKRPVIKPKKYKAKDLEKEIDLLYPLVEKSIQEIIQGVKNDKI